jgi:uncharacterized protein (DUF1501 family)
MMNRRTFLKWGGLTLLACSQGLHAAPRASQPVLVVVFLRGGLDGLHALVPYQSKEYYRARPVLGVPATNCLEIDDTFALNPAMKPLYPLFKERCLAGVCAIGTDDTSRSHFIAQDYLEYGGAKPTDGWLNRSLTDGIAVSTWPQIPTLLQGRNPVLNATSIEDLFQAAPPALFGAESQVGQVNAQEAALREHLAHLKPPQSNHYPDTDLGRQLRTVAYLLKEGVPVEAAHCELAGFDTHSRQIDGMWPGRLLGLNKLLRELSESVATFWRDVEDLPRPVTLITVTEFGRRLGENGSLGTDHGLASASFVLGHRVKGGKVYGQWPGLQTEYLSEGMDLTVTTDYRGLLNEYSVALERDRLFPGFSASSRLGLFA